MRGQDAKGSGQETGDAGSGTVAAHEEFSWRWKTDIPVLQRAAYLLSPGIASSSG